MKKLLLFLGLALWTLNGQCQWSNFTAQIITVPGPQQTVIDNTGITMSYDVLGDTGSAKFYLADQGDGIDAFSFEGGALNASKLYTQLIEMYVGGHYSLLVGSGSGITTRVDEQNIFSVTVSGVGVYGDVNVLGTLYSSGSLFVTNAAGASVQYGSYFLTLNNGTNLADFYLEAAGFRMTDSLYVTDRIQSDNVYATNVTATNITVSGTLSVPTMNVSTLNATNVWFMSNLPPAAASAPGAIYLWNSNGQVIYALVAPLHTTAWSSTNPMFTLP